jgi:integrase
MDAERFSGHSLRSGLVTVAAKGGANEVAIMETTGHTSPAMVRRCVQPVEVFRNNVAAAAGL